jgi:ABC-type nitrate/sulfonate/bicarbonate transport system permease component
MNGRMSSSRVTGPVLGVTGFLLFLLAWELVPRLGIVQERFLPPASKVLLTLIDYLGQGSFWRDVGETMLAWTIGLGISAIAAVLLGLVIGSSAFLSKATYTTVEFLRPIPSVALIPLAVLLFGVELESSLFLVIYASFWQVLLQVLYGVADVDPVADNTARSYGLGPLARARYVVWPTVLPYLMTGLRLGSAVALILAITAELVIGSPGLGYQIALTQAGGAVPEMYALIVVTGIIGIIINFAMRFIEKKVLAWHASVRREVVV